MKPDSIEAFDKDEREAFIRGHAEHPEKNIDQLTAEIAEQFRERWFNLLRQGGAKISGQSED